MKTNRELVKKEIEVLEIQNSISRNDAIRIDDLLEGELFERIPMNSFTEIPSKQNFKDTLKILHSFKVKHKEYSEEESLKFLEIAITAVDRMDVLTDFKLPSIIYEILMSNSFIFKVERGFIPFKKVTISEIPEVLEQLKDMFEDDISRYILPLHNAEKDLSSLFIDKSPEIASVIDYGNYVVSKKRYREELDRMRKEIVNFGKITSYMEDAVFDYPEASVVIVKFLRALTTLKNDIIETYKDQHGHL